MVAYMVLRWKFDGEHSLPECLSIHDNLPDANLAGYDAIRDGYAISIQTLDSNGFITR